MVCADIGSDSNNKNYSIFNLLLEKFLGVEGGDLF